MPTDMVDAVLSQHAGQGSSPQQSGQQQPDAVDDILSAAEQMPQIMNRLQDDPAGVSATLHASVIANKTGQQPDVHQAQALSDAYKSMYGQRNMEFAGGNAAIQEYLASNAGGFGHDIAATVGPHVSSWFTNPLGLVAPETAANIQRNAELSYGTPQDGSAGNWAGRAVNVAGDALPLLAGNPAGAATALSPVAQSAALTGYFGLTGAGGAREQVATLRQQGQEIGGGQEAAYTALTGTIQSVLAHYLGKFGAGGIKQLAGGELTETVPLQGLIRRFSPEMLKSIQGTDGAVLRPIIQKTLLNMGVGAAQNEVANIAQNIATNITGIAHPDLLAGSGQALAQGAAFGGLGHARAEIEGNPTRGPVEQVPQENIQQMGTIGKEGSVPRNVRYVEEPGAEPANETQQPKPLEGQALLDQMKKQNEESDALLNGPFTGSERGNGKLPENTSLVTGEPEHPLVAEMRKAFPQVQQSTIPEEHAADFAALKEHGIEAIPVQGAGIPEGFQHPDHPSAVLVDVSDEMAMDGAVRNAIVHEAAHSWYDANPAAADRLYRMIPEEERARLANEYYDRAKPVMGHEGAQNYLAKNKKTEVLSMAMGEAVQGNERLQRAFRGDGTLWDSVKDHFAAFFGSFTGKGRMVNEIAKTLREGLGVSENPVTTPDNVSEDGRQYPPAAGYPDTPATREIGAQLAEQHGIKFDGVQEGAVEGHNYLQFTDPDTKSTLLLSSDQDLGKKLETMRSKFTAKSGGRQLPKNYFDVGHKGSKANEELWWMKDGEINKVKSGVGEGKAVSHPTEALDGPAYGRIDHTSKEISVLSTSSDIMGDKRAEKIAEKLQGQYPDHKVYVEGRGGLIPLEELQSDGRYMLSKLSKVANSGEEAQAEKDRLNAASPKNAIKFETTAEDKVKRAVFDNQAPLMNMLRTAMNRVNDPTKLSPEAYVRRMFGFRERRFQQEKQGLRDIGGAEIVDRKTGENLTRQWLVDPLLEYAKTHPAAQGGEDAKALKANAHSVMIAQRTMEKYARMVANGEDLNKPITGEGSVRPGSDPIAKKDNDEAQLFLAHAAQEPHHDAALEYARRYRQWENIHGDMAVEAGILSKKAWTAMKDDNQFHVNMQRVMEDNGVLGDEDFADGTYHRFRGSNRMTDDPLSNMLQTTEQIAKKAEVNFTKQKIMDLAGQFPDMVQKAKKAGQGTVTVKENGEDKFYHVDPEVASTINGWGDHVPSALWGALSLPGRLKAFGTLLRPMFRWNHFRKQLQNRLIVGEESGGLKGFIDTYKGFDGDTKELLDVLGGTMSRERDYGTSSEDYYKLVDKAMAKMGGDKNMLLALPRKAWQGYQKLGEWSDAFNRVVEFKAAYAAAKRRGMNELDAQNYAAWKARDLMDFSVAGEVVKRINRIAYQPFLNAEMQGLRKVYEMARNDPGKAAQRLALFGLLPSMIPFLWAKSHGKEKEYKDTPLAQRIMFYQFQVGDYRVVVPKGQTQAMASAMWEAFLDKHNGDVATWAHAMGASGLIPRPIADPESAIPFTGVREAVSNYSWFYDKHIIPPDQEGLALDLRNTDGASGVSKWISKIAQSKAGWEVDPRKIDHVLANDIGTVGLDLETASNLGREDKPLGSTGLLSYGDVRLRPGYTAVPVQDAMKAADRYRDTSSPQYKAMEDALSESYHAKTVKERNAFVDKAIAAADEANDFYAKHGEELLNARKASQQIRKAVDESEQQKTLADRQAWALSNPKLLALVRDKTRLETLETRVSELRKALVNPRLDDKTKAMAERDITRLYGVIAKMVADATR